MREVSRNGSGEEFRLLEQKTSSGCTALCMAVIAGKLEVVGQLLDAGADIDAPDGKGRSPLYLAASGGNAKMCAALACCGADLHKCALDGMEP
ncbi:unnamed protein product, partial [Choristocarpus tenellus]